MTPEFNAQSGVEYRTCPKCEGEDWEVKKKRMKEDGFLVIERFCLAHQFSDQQLTAPEPANNCLVSS